LRIGTGNRSFLEFQPHDAVRIAIGDDESLRLADRAQLLQIAQERSIRYAVAIRLAVELEMPRARQFENKLDLAYQTRRRFTLRPWFGVLVERDDLRLTHGDCFEALAAAVLSCHTGGGSSRYTSDMAKPSDSAGLKRAIRAAGYEYQTVDRTRIELLFAGPYRSWTIRASLNEHWLSLGAYVCSVPDLAGRRAALADVLLRLNDENSLTKYSFHQSDVYLELQYRHDHMNGETMSGLIGLMLACADDDYPRIARVLTGDDALERLGNQFQLPTLGQTD
jgi:hypothetical protein